MTICHQWNNDEDWRHIAYLEVEKMTFNLFYLSERILRNKNEFIQVQCILNKFGDMIYQTFLQFAAMKYSNFFYIN